MASRPAKPASGQDDARIREAVVIGSVWGLLAIGALLASVTMGLLWAVAVQVRDASHVDVAWAILIACAAIAYALLADGDVGHRVLAALLASIWGFRLGLYLLFDRVLGKDEDGRYRAFREKWGAVLVAPSELLLRVGRLARRRARRDGFTARLGGVGGSGGSPLLPVPRHRNPCDGGAGAP